MEDLLPTVSDYTIFLHKAVSKFNLPIKEVRNKYGLYTYKQWEELLKD
jgi:hypothetical protein